MSASNPLKQRLRSYLRLARNSLSPQERKKKAIQLTRIIAQLPEFLCSQHIAAYWPQDGEIDPLLLLQRAEQMGKRCYLPVLHPLGFRELWFVEYKMDDPLIPNRFGILEPQLNLKKQIPAWALHLVLTPLVAFDRQGQRLGMGRGFYDRTFSFLKDNTRPGKPILIGLAYELQGVKKIPVETWDIPLQGIATEKRYISTVS